MAVATLHTVHGVNTPSTFYGQVTNGRVVSNTSMLRGMPSGNPYPLFGAVQAQAPVVEFTTSQVSDALAEFGVIGLGRAAGNNVDFYEAKVTRLGTREAAASSVHLRFRINESLGFISSIIASHQGVATADVRIIAAYDGTNEPIVPAGSQVLAGTYTSAVAEYFGVGPLTFNTVNMPGIQSISIDFALAGIAAGSESVIWDTFNAVGVVVPVITITAIDSTAWTDITLDGAAISDVTCFYLRKKAPDGTNVPDATAQHIKFTVSSGMLIADEDAGGANDPVVSTYRIIPRSSAVATAPLTVSAASAIT